MLKRPQIYKICGIVLTKRSGIVVGLLCKKAESSLELSKIPEGRNTISTKILLLQNEKSNTAPAE